MSEIKSNRELWGVDFPIGAEWDAGVTAPHVPPDKAGRWTVRREAGGFAVTFHHFQSGAEDLLNTFPPTETGEVAAKIHALASRLAPLIK